MDVWFKTTYQFSETITAFGLGWLGGKWIATFKVFSCFLEKPPETGYGLFSL